MKYPRDSSTKSGVTSGVTVEKSRIVGKIRWSHRLSYDHLMLKYKIIKFPPWLFSTMLNTAISRKTHTPDSHWSKLLPCFCLLKWPPWTIQVTAGATVKWQFEWQWSNSKSAGRLRCSHGLGYNNSMLEYKFIRFPPWHFSILSNTVMSRKTHAPDSHWWKPLPWFCLWRPGL